MGGAMTWQARLDAVLRSWQGTPFGRGQCCRGRAVDCRYFVVGVLDELTGTTAPLPPRLSPMTGVQDRAQAVRSVREMQQRYGARPLPAAGFAPEPGDVLIVRREVMAADTLAHAMIYGVGDPMPLWHAGRGGVVFTSAAGWLTTHAFRVPNKQSWAVDNG